MSSTRDVADVDVFRILVVEDIDSTLTDIESHLERFPHIEVLPATRARDAESLLDASYIDAAILDVQLHGKDAGIDVLRVMTERAPRATVVIATRYPDRVAAFVGVSAPRIAGIVHKGEEGTSDTWAADAIETAYTAWADSRVTIGNLELAVAMLRARADRIEGLREDDHEVAFEIERLMRALFGWVSITGLGTATSIGVDLSRIEREGLSPAITLRAAVSLGEDAAGQRLSGSPVILKIGPVEAIRTETDRYHRFVKYGVPLIHRVELLGSAEDQSLGALCYSFAADNPVSNAETLDQALSRDDWEQHAAVALYKLFDAPSKSWYAVTGERVSPVNYARKYWKIDFAKCAKALDDTLRAVRARLRDDTTLIIEAPGEHDDGKLAFGAARLRLPAKKFYTAERFTTSLPTRLVHGDMHGGNVMVETLANNEVRPRLIDYGSVGPGPRLADFAALEASVRLADAQMIASTVELDEAGQARDPVAFQKALMTCANREREERRILRAWAGEELNRAPTVQWASVSQRLAALAAINFPRFDPGEYYAIATLVAYRHLGLEVDTLVRVRIAAWLSALYEQAGPPDKPRDRPS